LVRHISEPRGLGVRTDGYVYAGYEIPIYYDPMISKLIVWARTREGAIARMKRALYEYKISGVKTSIKFLESIMKHHDFEAGKYNTHFIEDHFNDLFKETHICDYECEDLAIVTAFVDYLDKLEKLTEVAPPTQNGSYWKKYGRTKNVVRI